MKKRFKIHLDKKAQLSVFIILGILILIVIFLLFFKNNDFLSLILGKNPVERIEECSLDYLKESVGLTSSRGGSINPENFYLYKGNKVGYICYTMESFQKCVMQKPLLKSSVERELEGYIGKNLDGCLNEVKLSVEKQGGIMRYDKPEIKVELVPGNILVDINLNLDIVNNGKNEIYKSIKTDLNSKLYDFVITASEIANTEAKYGDSDTTSLMIKDKTLKIEKIKQGDETKVYIITDRDKGDNFIFAIRSIPIPPGWIELEKFK